MRTPFVAGNWKMHGDLAFNRALLDALRQSIDGARRSERAVCVPAPYLAQVQQLLAGSDIGFGAQDISEEAKGAFTGEVSASMLLEFGCKYAIVGHSERRARHLESDQRVAAKAKRALESGLTPIVCVGETLAERDAGQTLAVVGRQLAAVIDLLGADKLVACVVAYEPVWAIGTGRTASPEQAQEVHAALRAQIAQADAAAAQQVRIVYGGSVKADNAETLFAQADIDGGLVGGAALVAGDFAAIVAAADAVAGGRAAG